MCGMPACKCRNSNSLKCVSALRLIAATLLSRGYVAAMAAAVLEHAVEQHFMPQFKASRTATVNSHHPGIAAHAGFSLIRCSGLQSAKWCTAALGCSSLPPIAGHKRWGAGGGAQRGGAPQGGHPDGAAQLHARSCF
jgi:hypothetical protein